MANKKDTSNHYVDNKKLYTEMVKFISDCRAAAEKGQERPEIPRYIGYAIYSIANKLSTKSNFANYTYRDEMISDGIETCVRYVDRFNPDKYNNPFAYFTKIVYFSFLQRIEKEKKQTLVKHKVLENSVVMNTLVEMDTSSGEHFDASHIDLSNEKIVDLIQKFERKRASKKGTVVDEEHDADAHLTQGPEEENT